MICRLPWLPTLLLGSLITLTPGPAYCQPDKPVVIVATAYCLKGKTSSGPTTTQVHNLGGCIALSRDLVQILEAQFGDLIEVEGVGTFIFADRMPPQWRMRVDIFFPTRTECFTFGVKRCNIKKIPKGGSQKP